MNALKIFCRIGFIRKMILAYCRPGKTALPVNLFGLSFRNAVGLGAGFDKNALYLPELEALGFGFVEIGTVTPLPQPGNEPPRLFRLKEDLALINRMGFNNDGVHAIAARLKTWNTRHTTGNQQPKMIIGGNIGKNKSTPNEDAWKDYETCFRELYSCVDYFVVNVSSPNTAGLRALQEKGPLKKILTRLQEVNREYSSAPGAAAKPVLLKIAPDLTSEQIDDVIALAMDIQLDGLVATNTSISRDHLRTPAGRLNSIGNGGLSGMPLKTRSTAIVQYIHEKTGGKIPIIASGGIFNRADAAEKMQAGASLVEVWTGFIYEGPCIVKKIFS